MVHQNQVVIRSKPFSVNFQVHSERESVAGFQNPARVVEVCHFQTLKCYRKHQFRLRERVQQISSMLNKYKPVNFRCLVRGKNYPSDYLIKVKQHHFGQGNKLLNNPVKHTKIKQKPQKQQSKFRNRANMEVLQVFLRINTPTVLCRQTVDFVQSLQQHQ